MDKHYQSDKPISNETEDYFQRYGFAKRIATTIIERDGKDSLVIGVYGAWGEGKTSVINFIENELKTNKNIIPIKFNPWRYGDEDSLLNQFFGKLANALEITLKKKKEKLGELLKEYGSLLTPIPFIGKASGAVETIGKALGNVDIETLKDRIDKILKSTKTKVVIFIDDIDRLDKAEVHSIFRLIKLVADFPNTIYVLAFDPKMVSSAIGERFGAGDQKSGQSFLEKIIQVPLEIPMAQPIALQQFCFHMLNNSLNSNNIRLTTQETRRFANEFTSNILIKLTTPRLAVRYGNSLSFSMPLLFGEVNIVDLMLIEAIKVFYPSHYEFIKSNQEFFIGSYRASFSGGVDKEKREQLVEHLDNLGKDLTRSERTCIKNLLEELFPIIKDVTYDNGIINGWSKNMRIASKDYFNRYFNYAVIKGQISDVAFNEFIFKIPNQSIVDITDSLRLLVTQSSPDSFINKIRSIEDKLEWNTSTKLTKAISISSEILPRANTFTMGLGFDTANGQAAIFIYRTIKNHSNKEEQFELAKYLMVEAKPFQFAYDINSWLRSDDNFGKKIFTTSQYIDLAQILVDRALQEAGDIPIFEKFPDQVHYLFKAWALYDKERLTKYIVSIIKKNPKKCVELLRAFTPSGFSSAVVGPTKFDFTNEQYRFFISLFDKNVIHAALQKLYTGEDLNSSEIKWDSTGDGQYQTDINIVRQFIHWKKIDDNDDMPNESIP